MEQRSSITSLMSSFGRAYHSENAKNPVFDDFKARELMTDDEYRSIAGYILGGIDFFAPEMKGKFESGEKALEYLVNTQIAPHTARTRRILRGIAENCGENGHKAVCHSRSGNGYFCFQKSRIRRSVRDFRGGSPAHAGG